MSLAEHQRTIASRILAHPDLGTIAVIVEADVPDVQSAVMKALQSAFLAIVVANGPGEVMGDSSRDTCLVLEERFIITIGCVPALGNPPLTPFEILDRLLPWLHFLPWSEKDGSGVYRVSGHAPVDPDAGLAGHQLTLATRIGIIGQ